MKAELKWSEKYKKVSRRNKPAASMISVFNTHTAALDSVMQHVETHACVSGWQLHGLRPPLARVQLRVASMLPCLHISQVPVVSLMVKHTKGGVSIMVHRCRWSCWMGR